MADTLTFPHEFGSGFTADRRALEIIRCVQCYHVQIKSHGWICTYENRGVSVAPGELAEDCPLPKWPEE